MQSRHTQANIYVAESRIFPRLFGRNISFRQVYYQLTSHSLIPVDSKSTKFGFDRSEVYIVFLNCIKLTGSVLVFISFQKVCAGVSYKKFRDTNYCL